MNDTREVTIRTFGCLYDIRCEMGLPATVTQEVPEDGISAGDLATGLGLPHEQIEGVFLNGTVYSLGHIVMPGDRVAFVPYGTPGPHRFNLGLYAAGKEGEE
ncbi:MAG: MoaD/ThiS family protein [Actinobacteria bacterium]|nr:MAG: MoaD/ThiS family protein [Actinomycetota bacterium]